MMKTWLKISVLLNLLLLACLAFLTSRSRTITVASEPITRSSTTPETASAPTLLVQPKPFRWNQLESTNYLTYIQNLRGIGCPEQTIRDIITADVGSLYELRAQQVRQMQLSSPAALERELQKLAAEKASVIARLLGTDTTQLTVESYNTPSTNAESHGTDAPVSMPLVWQDVDFSRLKLNGEQTEAIANLRQVFMNKIGGADQDTSSPGYRERWQKAQPETDDALAGLVGRNEFLLMQVLASGSRKQ